MKATQKVQVTMTRPKTKKAQVNSQNLSKNIFTVFPDLSETRNIMQCTIQLGKTVKSVVDDKFFEQPLQVQKMMRNLKVVKVIAVIAPRETGAKMMVTMPTPTVTTMTTTEPTLIMSKLQSLSRQKRTRLKKRSLQRK